MAGKFHLNPRLLLAIIVLFAATVRFWRLDLPAYPYFDEVYHVQSARLITQNSPMVFEWWHLQTDGSGNFDWLHPPLAKYVQAFFMISFGDNSIGWRFGSALFGILVVIATYFLAQELFNRQELSLTAALLVSLDGLILVQSRIAMNDIYLTFFFLITLIFYLKYFKQKNNSNSLWLLAVGFSSGLAISTKWTGFLLIALVVVLELRSFIKQFLVYKKDKYAGILRKIPWRLFTILLLPVGIYLFSFLPMFLHGKNLNYFFALHRNIAWYQTHRDSNHLYSSTPLKWLFNIRPVWYWHETITEIKEANIYALDNPLITLFSIAALILTVFFLLAKKNKTQKKLQKEEKKLLWFLFTAYLSIWLPWIFSPRIMFYYHYTPAVPLLCILISFWLIKIYSKRLKVLILLLEVVMFVFFLYLPNWIGLSVHKTLINTVYFAISSWK